eukprot:gnl/TRDRNA2_/TRDRNA2_49943_c0_seq1.p1 gnl/TRDRNA2_/TRDRNA2_49943_c0~~gnl/TRDRNA2_/TRDRNA2_49943_c0_seq1.p1  ORF type:complete len:482 (-),score=114.70 gnl/TRDRNA2_/TRDRNA2_49943_c0_seq1:78-1472(-)
MAIAEWEASWRAQVADIAEVAGSDAPYAKSVERMRQLLKSGVLRQADIRDNPERFLLAHKVLAELATKIGPGFWIRFTVQFNLFAGSIVALGNKEQVEKLSTMQAAGKVGCFGLTEQFAGVNSGLVVNTTCTWDPERQMFRLHCPNTGARKNWISQGLVADMCVAVADLIVGGKHYGPHAFVMDLRDAKTGNLVEGVEVGDMGQKTIGNDLDNAWIQFTHVWIPKSALLNRFADIEGDKYVQKQSGIRNIDMIGQRLYTGRTVIARSALVFTRSIYATTKAYTDKKECWAPKGQSLFLGQVPQIASLYAEADAQLSRMESFMTSIEQQLADCLRHERIPPEALVEAIAAGKVKCVEKSIDLCWKLKQEVGSYALMEKTGFERLDYLQCCKFAEGDTRILMQKITRDRLKAFQKDKTGRATEEEKRLCTSLLKSTNPSHLEVYGLAERVIERTIDEYAKMHSSKL